MKKRYFYLLLVLILSVVFLFGCSGDDTSLLKLEATKNTIENINEELALVEINWQESKHKAISDTRGINMEIKEESISPIGLTLVFENISNKDMAFSDNFIIEKKINNSWYELPRANDKLELANISYESSYKQSKEKKVDFSGLYDKLDPGFYRIIKELVDSRSPGNYKEEYMAAEFTIK